MYYQVSICKAGYLSPLRLFWGLGNHSDYISVAFAKQIFAKRYKKTKIIMYLNFRHGIAYGIYRTTLLK